MEPKESGEIPRVEQYDCETLPQIYMKLVVAKDEEGQALSYWYVSEEMSRLLEGKSWEDYRFFGETPPIRDANLERALRNMETFGMIIIGEKIIGTNDFRFEVTEIGRQYANLFKTPEGLKPILK